MAQLGQSMSYNSSSWTRNGLLEDDAAVGTVYAGKSESHDLNDTCFLFFSYIYYTDGRWGLPMFLKLEKWMIAILFIGFYFGFIYHPGEPVFIGEFNNIDGSIYAVRSGDVVASLIIFGSVSFILIPSYLVKQKWIPFIAWSVVVVAVVSGMEYGLDRLVLKAFNLPTASNEFSDKMLEFKWRNVYHSTVIPGNLMVYALGLLYGLSRDWMFKSKKQRQLFHEKMKADIAFLRSQINPHFFFNALNNIYAMTRKKGDDEVGEAILKLSGMMRYMIYDSDVTEIDLIKEIDHIENVLDIARLKFSSDDPIDIQVRKKGSFEGMKIAPLILIPFVENAIKHGINNTGKGYIHIDIGVNQNTLCFRVKNAKYDLQDSFQKHPGIGLANVKRRLELLYPGNYDLRISATQDKYSVELKLNLG